MKDGDTEFDALAVLDAMYLSSPANSPAERASRWDYQWRDLVYRTTDLPDRYRMLEIALASRLTNELRAPDWYARLLRRTEDSEGRIPADVVIVCVLEREFNSALAAFGVALAEAEIKDFFGHVFVLVELPTRRAGTLRVWIGLIGEARNVVCANFCRDVIEAFAIKHCCILVGIAAGHQDYVKLGDVVGAKLIYDIEGARVEEGGEKPRYRPYPLPSPWRESFGGYNPERLNWLAERAPSVTRLLSTKSKIPAEWETQLPRYHAGTIVAGEKLRRDNPFPKLEALLGDELRALEMEGSGFAYSCEKKKVLWLVFRGVSDFGDSEKRDEWQSLAALHAALAAKNFLREWLRPVVEQAKF